MGIVQGRPFGRYFCRQKSASIPLNHQQSDWGNCTDGAHLLKVLFSSPCFIPLGGAVERRGLRETEMEKLLGVAGESTQIRSSQSQLAQKHFLSKVHMVGAAGAGLHHPCKQQVLPVTLHLWEPAGNYFQSRLRIK